MLKKILRVTSSVKKLNQMGNEKKTIHCTTQVMQHKHKKRKSILRSVIGSRKVLRWALAASLASTLLFILGSYQAGIVPAASPSSQWLMTAGHLLAAFGNSVLLWGTIAAFGRFTSINLTIFYLSVPLVAAYHLAAAIGYLFGFYYTPYTVATMLLWSLKTILCCLVTFAFLSLGNKYYRDDLFWITALTLLTVSVASCPFSLPGFWGIAQWVVAKLAALLLPVLLYWNSADEIENNY